MILVKIHWHILAYFLLIPLFLLVSIILTIIYIVSAFFFDHRISRINPRRFGAALTIRCSRVSESPLPLSSLISDSLSASQSFSLSFGIYKSPFQLSQFPVSEMLAGELSSSLLAGWGSICFIWWTFNTWVCPAGRSFADKAAATGDFSVNLNAAALSYWQCDQDALMITSVPEMYLTAAICLFWAWDSFCVACRFLAALPHLQKVVDLGHSVHIHLLRLSLHLHVIISTGRIHYWVVTRQ